MQFDPQLLQQCLFLAGPTASGKSALAVPLAEQIGAEILCLDSMTVYRGLEIGTAKPTPAERQRVPHHLLDLADPHEEFSVSMYLPRAEQVCREILARGRTPFFVGGSGLYLRSLLRGLFEGPAADWSFRQAMQTLAEQEGPDSLHRRLTQVDPVTAARLHLRDQRRIIRALEVYELTGRPLSQLQQEQALPIELRPRQVYWLDPDRSWLHQRIDRRVEEMFEQGLVEEVQGLLANGVQFGRTARMALGYAEVLEHLQGSHPHGSHPHGGPTREETILAIQQHTRQFAKRQCTWFRNLEECQPIPIGPGTSTLELEQELHSRFTAAHNARSNA